MTEDIAFNLILILGNILSHGIIFSISLIEQNLKIFFIVFSLLFRAKEEKENIETLLKKKDNQLEK